MNSATNPFSEIFLKQQRNRTVLRNRGWKDRIKKLNDLHREILFSRNQIQDALYEDFRKPRAETDITEIYVVLNGIRYLRSHLRNWMRPQHIATPLALLGTHSSVLLESKGTCLIISPWNYPFNLSFSPLSSAIAAGNSVILKPSEHTPATNKVMMAIIEKVFPRDEVCMVEGSSDAATLLLDLPFDHIFFTGSNPIGKKIMEAASRNLSSVTLELGGKSPAYVHSDAAVKDAAEKIAAAKFVNAGQTCIAPDYLLVHEDVYDSLTSYLSKEIVRYYGADGSEKFPAIINKKHFERLQQLRDPAYIDHGNIMKPELIHVTDLSSKIMQEEIFGPLLPLVKVKNKDEALQIINNIPAPLAIYIFSARNNIMEYFRELTVSGNICHNECGVQFLHPSLPFGGAANSGFGRSHGYAGFKSFSNERTIFRQRTGFTTAKLLYPPYTRWKQKLIDLLLKYF